MTAVAVAEPATFPTAAALALGGVSYRRLDYWCTSGVFDSIDTRWHTNPGSGVARRWTVEHVHALTVCARLVEVVAEDEGTGAKNLPTVVLAHAVAALVRHGYPTDGVIMVDALDAVWADDPYEILGYVLAGPPLLVLPLRRADRPTLPE